MATWRPDFCLDGRCAIELQRLPGGSLNWLTPQSLLNLCARHQAIKDAHGLTDTQIHRLLVIISRRKERLRWEAKLELGLGGDAPIPMYLPAQVARLTAAGLWPQPTPYILLEAGGGYRLVSGLGGAALTALRARIANALVAEGTATGAEAIAVD